MFENELHILPDSVNIEPEEMPEIQTIPNVNNAVIEESKIKDYLLNPEIH